MRKSDKKIENQIREVLTDVCEGHIKRLRWLSMGDSYGQIRFFSTELRTLSAYLKTIKREHTFNRRRST